jgi:O-antigen/teichoic acid export membrane protein
MLTRAKNLLTKKFIKDTFVLQFGSVFSSGIFFVGSVVLARVLGVDGYGQYVLIFAFISLVNLFTNWGEQGVALTIAPEAYAKGDINRFKEVIKYFFFITIISTLIVNIAVFFFAPQLTEMLYHNAQIGNFARVVLLMSILQIIYLFFTVILQIVRNVKYLAIIDIFNKFFHVSISVLLVLFGYGLWGIVYGKLLVAVMFLLFTVLAYTMLARKNESIPSLKELVFGIKYGIVKKFFRFGVAISLDKNIGSLFGLLPIILLGFHSSTDQVSFYKIAYSYIALPTVLLSPVARLLSVQLPQSKAYGLDILRRDFWRSTLFSGFINMALVILFLVPAKYAVELFYGIEFIGSVEAIYYLSIVMILSGFNIGLGSMIKTIRKVKYSIVINILTIFVQLASFFLMMMHFHYSVLISVIASQIILTVFNMIIIFAVVIRYLKINGGSQIESAR